MFKKAWVKFCKYTTIHGLHYIFVDQKNHKSKQSDRIIWSIIWMLTFVLTAFNCGKFLCLYLQYDIKSVITYENMNELPFPAITLCNINMFLKSVVTSNEIGLYIMSILTGNQNNQSEAVADGNRTCHVNGPQKVKTIMELTQDYDRWSHASITEGMQMMAANSYTSAVKCWWNDQVTDCRGIFLNHPDTYGSCFTFNCNESFVNMAKDSTGKFFPTFGYGLNTTNYMAKKQPFSGPKFGLRILLNTNQLEYCGVFQKWSGAGFRAYIHDSRAMTSYFMDKPLLIRPGSDLSISIRPTLFEKKTEHLGKCVSNVKPLLGLTFSGFYSQVGCMVECATIFIFSKCKCLPPFDEHVARYAASGLGVAENTVKICKSWESVKCIISYQPMMQKINFEDFCPRCKTPCRQSKYDYSVTSLKFPAGLRDVHKYSRLNISTFEAEAKNYGVVNFYFENMDLFVVQESQKISLEDVFIYFGGVIGLFLGMSFVSVYELTYESVACFSIYIWHNCVPSTSRSKQKTETFSLPTGFRSNGVRRISNATPVKGRTKRPKGTELSRVSLAVVDDLFRKSSKSSVETLGKTKNVKTKAYLTVATKR